LILFELLRNENHPAYRSLEVSNGQRQYDFLRSIVLTAFEVQQPFLSQSIITALNFHAIACLHTYAGEYRPCPVSVGDYRPPEHYQVNVLMEHMVNTVNRLWETSDPVFLAAYVLWRINHIHPFINGNGRTARAACYFVLCVKVGAWLPGDIILPELLRRDRDDYIDAMKKADQSLTEGQVDLSAIHGLIMRLLTEQLEPFSGNNLKT